MRVDPSVLRTAARRPGAGLRTPATRRSATHGQAPTARGHAPTARGHASSVRRTGRVAALVAALLAALLTGAGCGSLAQAQQTIGRADLVNDLAARLTAAGQLTYTADYQLPGGGSASIAQAQQPLRTAYTYPEGGLTVAADATTECLTTGAKAACTRTAPPSPGTNPAGHLFAEPGEAGLVPPALVVALLSAAALDTDAVIEQNDTTVAGEHATCVRVREVENAAASAFDTCITTVGVLGSFTGLVNGSEVDMTMTRYRDGVEPFAFSLPARATVVDRRPGAK